MAAEKSEKRKCLYLGVCCSYNHGFAADFDIIKSRRPNGIKVRSIFGIIMYVNQYGGRETGSSYNFWPVAGRNVISNATTMFSGVAVTMQYRLSCNFIEIYVKFNMAAAIYNVDCFRFVGRHLELLVMSHHRQCWGMLLVVSYHQNCWKPHENTMPCYISTWFSKSTKNFNRVFVFPAAILDFRCNIGQQFSWRFVAQPYLGKVTKPFHFIPNGSEMPLKRSVWGVNYSPVYNGRVK